VRPALLHKFEHVYGIAWSKSGALAVQAVCSGSCMTLSLACVICRDSAASTTANASLSADDIIDTYGDADRTLNATATSSAALAMLACKVRSTVFIGCVSPITTVLHFRHVLWIPCPASFVAVA